MVLILKEQLDRIRSNQPATVTSTQPALQSTQTIGDNLTCLDNEMRKILDSKTYTNDHERLKDYLRVLQRYLFFVEEKRKVGKDNNYEDSSGMSEDIIVESMPKHYQKEGSVIA